MSNHLRHCPKHRKPLPCSHCALIHVSVAEPEPTPEPVATEPAATEPAPKRGRPRIHESGAARTQAHRDKQREKEKLKQVAAILRVVQRYLSRPSKKVAASTVTEIHRQNREYIECYRADLVALPYNKIQQYYDVLVARSGIRDSRGKLQGERSGETPQKNGMSELETIIAAASREDGELPAKPVRPGGYGPASYDKPDAYSVDDALAESEAPGTLRGSADYENLLERAVDQLADSIWPDDANETICTCTGTFTSKSEVKEHLYKCVRNGEKQLDLLILYQQMLGGETMAAMTRAELGGNDHYHEVRALMREIAEADHEKEKKARRLQRLVRQQRQQRRENIVTAAKPPVTDSKPSSYA